MIGNGASERTKQLKMKQLSTNGGRNLPRLGPIFSFVLFALPVAQPEAWRCLRAS
jgi:hypothetical protein